MTRTTVLPLCLLVYLAVLAWIGRGRLEQGEYLYYFGVIGCSLVLIGLLWLVLRKRERLRREREEQDYGTYDDAVEEGSTADEAKDSDETNDSDEANC